MRLCPGPSVALDGATSWPSFYDSNNITALQYGTLCYMGEYWGDGGFFTSWEESNPETAIFSLPSDLSLLDPAWGVCSPYTYGALDPPQALIKATAGLMPASVLVPSPTPTDQAGPQETLAKPIPTLIRPPVQTQLGDQPPTLDPQNDPSEPADPAGGKDTPNDSPQGMDGSQKLSPDLPAPDAVADPKGAADPKTNPPNENQDAFPEPLDPDTDPSAQANANQGDPEPSADDTELARPPSLVSVLSIGGLIFTALPTSGFLLADTTIPPDGPAITIQGTPVSLGGSVLVVGSSTVVIPTGSANGVLTAAGVEFTPLGQGRIRLDGVTLMVNEPATTVSGTSISLGSSGIAIAGQTFAFPTLASEAIASDGTLTIAGQTITRLGGSKAIIDGVTLTINGPAEAVSGTSLSLASTGLMVDGQTYAFPTPAPDAFLPRPGGIFKIHGQTVTLLGTSSAIIDGTLFSINGLAKTISGITVSLASTALMLDGQAYPFSNLALASASNTVVIDGTTLRAGGPAMTISGTTLNLVSGTAGFYLTGIKSASSAFSIPVTARESMMMNAAGQLIEGGGGGEDSKSGIHFVGLGSLILLGFGHSGAASASSMPGATLGNATPVTVFEGNGNKKYDGHILSAFSITMYVGLLILCLSRQI